MKDNKKNEFLNYLEASILKCLEEEKKLIAESRKDEANLVKVRANIYQIFHTVYQGNLKSEFLEDSMKTLFLEKLETIPENWKISYSKAKAFDDVDKILIEEIKLQAAKEIKDKFLMIWECENDRG